ncbi:glutamine synthetase [Candidatus Epulonipiscioides gigas]|nr:glutamine synthetase [Epulopiscium sp. SCG-C07WGA-EpuloA2]
MKNIPELFGSKVFNDKVMQARLPKSIYKAINETVQNGKPLELNVANVVANAMKDWATELGATHFTHWFQPMTGITAEKHDSFISPDGKGQIIMEFSGKELVKGEPDASSFPSGGLRATFEARGYTVWDVSSYAFIKDDTLCIPTGFCSYSGDALDKKTPLLRSMAALNKEATKFLNIIGKTDVTKVDTTVGPEQEYFLIDKDMYLKRPDLIYTGRTLFGARPSKGQELDDHYFGTLKARVSDFMKDFDSELWQLGILSKTKHNEVAPAQHELAPIFSTTNIATDHNQLTMEIAKKVANRHGLACLLHEKPFAGVNGSGKHNNWSMSTNIGENLLEPGPNPSKNTQFLLFLSAVIKAVDEYQDMLRISVASAANDHRLGAHEAPPAIVSMFIGDELGAIVDSIINDTPYATLGNQTMVTGTNVLPDFNKDTTDRNRTSPFAFTGNKFEFRMLGSAFSISGPNIVLNTAVAEALSEFSKKLEGAKDLEAAKKALIKETLTKHQRIIFNGNNYSDEWVVEAEKRGLLNLKTTVDALPKFIEPKNIELFTKNHVFTEIEIHSRYEIFLEEYSKTINIEALTASDMARQIILPACLAYQKEVVDLLNSKQTAGICAGIEKEIATELSELCENLYVEINKLSAVIEDAHDITDSLANAQFYRDSVLAAMNSVRAIADTLELKVSSAYWPLPTYGELLYSVH